MAADTLTRPMFLRACRSSNATTQRILVENTSDGNRQLWQQTLADTPLACATLPNFVAGAPLAAH